LPAQHQDFFRYKFQVSTPKKKRKKSPQFYLQGAKTYIEKFQWMVLLGGFMIFNFPLEKVSNTSTTSTMPVKKRDSNTGYN
jgi:hypothetical protein